MNTSVASVLVACLSLCGCALTSQQASGPERDPTADLDVPPGHIPGVGQCRIWIPGRAPGRQAPVRNCEGIEAEAPAGSWILSRSAENRRLVRVAYVHRSRAGEVVRKVLYEASTGRFIREETPRRRGNRIDRE